MVTAPKLEFGKESNQEEDEEDNDDEYISDVEGDGKYATAVGLAKRSRESEGEEDGDEDEGQDVKKVKV